MEASTCHNDTYTFLFFVSAVTSKMELFGVTFNSFHFLIIATKNFILDVAGVLDPTLITDTFALHSWILISLKPILASHRNRSINSNGGEDGCLIRLYWFQIAWKNSCVLEVLTFKGSLMQILKSPYIFRFF